MSLQTITRLFGVSLVLASAVCIASADDVRNPAVVSSDQSSTAIAQIVASSESCTTSGQCGETCGEGCVRCGNGNCCSGSCCSDGCCRLQNCCQKFKSLFHGPDNMYPRLSYVARPKTYYYFRPYNHQHIRQHQMEANGWGASWGTPYSNAAFKSVYDQFEAAETAELPTLPALRSYE